MAEINKIHVLYIITKLELGGAQKVCLSLLQGLRDAGHKALLLSGAQGPLVDHVKDDSQVYLLPEFKREVSWKAIYAEWQTFKAVVAHLKQLKKQHPNLIVHTHSTKAGLIGRWAAFFAGIQHRIHTVHGYGFHQHQRWFIWFAIYFLELITSFVTTHFVCVSSADIATGKRLFPRFSAKHSLIRAAVDWEQFYIPAQLTSSFTEQIPFIFGTVACFKPQKNLFDLLKAFELVHQQNNHTRLEIIGDGTLRLDLERWIHEHNLMSAVKLHGWQQKVAPIMHHWHAFVLSSLWEGLPCAIVEARLLKLPVLAYNTGGISDVIHHGKNGFLYPQGDWQKLAKGMLSLTGDKELLHTLQSHPDQLDAFHTASMIAQHINLYQSLYR